MYRFIKAMIYNSWRILSALILQFNSVPVKSLCEKLFINLSENKRTVFRLIFKSKGFKAFCLTCFLLTSGMLAIQAQDIDYGVHANIIYRFTKYIDWPDNKKTGAFVIGIVGESPLRRYLKSFVSNKTVGNQKIIIKTYSPSAEEFDCHILFVCEDESPSFKKIVTHTAGDPILLVSEEEGLANKGSCVNFVIVDDRLKLEFNKTQIAQRHLNIATELLDLGKILK
jgi:hypothetical protein